MCRMILAHGVFNPAEILDGAIEMSEGRTARHNNPIRTHRDGCGLLLHHPGEKQSWSVFRSTSPLSESTIEPHLFEKPCDLMVVHARHATLSKNLGLEFTHPVVLDDIPDWFFFHNGYLPSVHQHLGMPASLFDSREYFEYLIPKHSSKLERSCVLEKLSLLGAGNTSGNAILVNKEHVHVICWYPSESKYPEFYTLRLLKSVRSTIVSSEILPFIGLESDWQSIRSGNLLQFELSTTNP